MYNIIFGVRVFRDELRNIILSIPPHSLSTITAITGATLVLLANSNSKAIYKNNPTL